MLRRRLGLNGARQEILVCLLLAAAAFWVFAPVRHFQFLNYDDDAYVVNNPNVRDGLTWRGVRWAFTADLVAGSRNADYWIPLTFLSHMAAAQFFGLSPAAHHLVNLALHVLGAILLFLVLRRMTGGLWESAFTAALFALHPMHVESVAWVSERKDVLSGVLLCAVLWSYARYAAHPGPGRYLLVALATALGLMAKPMLVTVPVLLTLLDVWPLRRLPSWDARTAARLALEKVPLALLCAGSALLTVLAARRAGWVPPLDSVDWGARVAHVCISYAAYLGKLVWPSGLAVFYPYAARPLLGAKALTALLALFLFTAAVLRGAARRPHLAVGWLWYLTALLPVIGLFHTGDHALADRYTYIPYTGIFLMASWEASRLAGSRPSLRAPLWVLALACLACLGVLSRRQLRHWTDSRTLFEHALAVTQDNYLAHNNLGFALAQEGRTEEAVAQLREAVRVHPRYFLGHYNLGSALLGQGKLDEAIAHFRASLAIVPAYFPARNNLGLALYRRGRMEEAIAEFREAIRLQPDYAPPHNNIGNPLSSLGRLDEAIRHYQEAARLNPGYADAWYNLGTSYSRRNMPLEAIGCFERVLSLQPGHAAARNNLGAAFLGLGRMEEAARQFRLALEADPGQENARQNLAAVLEHQRRSR